MRRARGGLRNRGGCRPTVVVLLGLALAVGCRAQVRLAAHGGEDHPDGGKAQSSAAADIQEDPSLDYVDEVVRAPVYPDGPVPIPGEEVRAYLVTGRTGDPVLVSPVRPGSVVAFNHRDAAPPKRALIRRHREPGQSGPEEKPESIPLTSAPVGPASPKEFQVAFDVPRLSAGLYDVWYEGGKPLANPADGADLTPPPRPKASQWQTLEIRAVLRAKSAVLRGKRQSIVDMAIGVAGASAPAIEVTVGGFDKVAKPASGQALTVKTGSDGFAHFKIRIAARGDTYLFAQAPGYSGVAVRVVGGPLYDRPDRRLQPGDVLECRGKSVVSDLIDRFERFELRTPNPLGRPWYSHTAIYLGKGEVAEMLLNGLVRHSLDDAFEDCTTVDAYRRNGVSSAQQAKIVESIRSYGEGAAVPYAKTQILAMTAAAMLGMNAKAAFSLVGIGLCWATGGATCAAQAVLQAKLRIGLAITMTAYGLADRGRQRMICSELATWAYQDGGAEFNASPHWPDVASRGMLLLPDAPTDFTTPNMISHSRDMDFVIQVVPPEAPAFIAGDQILLGEQVTFDFGSAAIRKDVEELLQNVADLIERHPEIGLVRVEGHTDNVGEVADNQKLSEKRALGVKNWLIAHGTAAERLTSAGLGESKPLVPNDEEHNRRRNRRVEFHISKK